MKTRTLTLLIALPAMSCATTPGAGPHEMSTAQHEAAAQQEDTTASGHAAQYDSTAAVTRERCGPRAGTARRADITLDPCWTSFSNPTDVHRRTAEEHRRHAADHRAGSAALREAEGRACVGFDADDRDISPFEHIEDIASVTPLKVSSGGKGPTEQTVGAVVTFRAVPSMTAEWLQRVVDCHLARNASLGHVVPEMPNCPLVPKGVTATTTSTGNGFAVSIRSSDPATAKEILVRAQRLVSPTGTNVSSQR
jgi:hypothetical protein